MPLGTGVPGRSEDIVKFFLGSGYHFIFYVFSIWAAAPCGGSPADARIAGGSDQPALRGTAGSRGAFEHASAVCSNISPYYLIHITELYNLG